MIERFDVYMDRCLYHPVSGFYAAGIGSAGRRRGDFITSPEVGPLFAEVVGRALDQWWYELGRPDPYVVIDAGTGPGALARGLRRGSGASGPARQVVGVDHGDALPDVAGAVIIANELLDNVPFRMIERSGDGWLEVWVDDRGAAGVEEVLRPLDADAVGLVPPSCADLAPGTRLPLLEQAAGWMGDVLARGPAAVLMFDYGALTTVELARRGGWLRTYRHHQRGHDPYREAGQWDITTDIAVDQLPGRPETTDQATFLHRWGIDDLVAQGRRYWTEHAGRPDVTAIRMRSRVAEAEALLDPDGLGGWLTCLWRP